jgi:hypothetical protein
MIPRPLIFLILAALASCGDKQDTTATTVDHSGSIETAITVEHADSTHDVVLTTHKVWTNGQISGTIIHRDTIPGLGLLTADGVNGNGDTKTVTVAKDYQIFITVK